MDSFWRLGSGPSFLKDTGFDITDAEAEYRNKEEVKFSDKFN